MTENEATTTTMVKPQVFTRFQQIDWSKMDLSEEVIQLNRVAKVVKGGRRFSFSALVVVGDRNGHVGVGFGKANEVPESIQKAMQDGRKNLIKVPRVGDTIPYKVTGAYAAARVLLRPASEGTGLIAGPAVRTVLELAGLHNVLTKSLGSSNVINILKAVIEGLKSLRDAEQVARLRGRKLEDILGNKRAERWREGVKQAEENVVKASKPKRDGGGRRDGGQSRRQEKSSLVVTPAAAKPVVEVATVAPEVVAKSKVEVATEKPVVETVAAAEVVETVAAPEVTAATASPEAAAPVTPEVVATEEAAPEVAAEPEQTVTETAVEETEQAPESKD